MSSSRLPDENQTRRERTAWWNSAYAPRGRSACSDDRDGNRSQAGPGSPEAGVPDSNAPVQPGWDKTFGLPGIAGNGHPTVRASAKLGDGQIVITGSFQQVGPVVAPYAALWNGHEWKAIGDGLSDGLDRLAATPSGELFGSVAYLNGELRRALGR